MELRLLGNFYLPYREQAKQLLQNLLIADNQHFLDGEFYTTTENDLLSNLFNQSHIVLLSLFDSIGTEASFEQFADSLQQPEVHQYICERYQNLDPCLTRITKNWCTQLAEILNAFHADHADIVQQFFPSEPNVQIQKIQFSQGDKHNNGQAVAILCLSNEKKLVFKPRTLEIDLKIAKLYQWINNYLTIDLKLPSTLNCDHHGWVEFIDSIPCEDPQDLDQYYRRMGGITGLVYVLGGTDFHYENIIAHGSHPVLIDLETFFHPPMPDGGMDAAELVDDTVMRTGILPTTIMNASDFDMPSISGVTDVEGTEGIFEANFLEQKEDGTFHFVRKKGELKGANNIPILDGEKYPLSSTFIPPMVEGFKQVYQLVMNRIDEFSALVSEFEDVQIRIIVRNTACYSYLLSSANHPDVMRTQESMSEHFRLIESAVKDFSSSQPLVAYEFESLMNGDVPYFVCRAGSRDLQDGHGKYYKDFFPESGYKKVMQELTTLSEHKLHFQTWLIERTLCLEDKSDDTQHLPASAIDSVEALAQVHLNSIEENIFQDQDFAAWLVTTSASLDNSSMSIINASYDLYCGVAGEGIFLAALQRISGHHNELFEKVISAFEDKITRNSESIISLGAFIGWGGIFKAYNLLARLTGECKYLDKIEYWLDTVDFSKLIQQDKNINLIKGTSGFLQSCADVYALTKNSKALALAEQCVDKLMATRCLNVEGFGWKLFSAKPLSGVAHGSSGFAMSFASLFAVTQKEKYREYALACLDYEQTLFVPEQGNWQDIREIVLENTKADEKHCSLAWAHGAPGIGLARLHLLKCGIDSDNVREQLEIALETTLAAGVQASDSVIFGDYGNVELLTNYSAYMQPDQEKTERIQRMTQALIERLGQNLGVGVADKLFGMMPGYTGCVFQALRAKHSKDIPSFLTSTDIYHELLNT